MPSPARPTSCPSGKKCLSKGKAAGVVDKARRSRHEHRQEQRTYFCRRCGCWHTTKEEYRTAQERAAYRTQL